ncbi:phosphatase PAP2 family protein [Roseateles sp. DC23W]|uniref:Phosphatase PAP2 family protein n=2 Tax=Pelomonas dachongensis TaxID=3299029 RepID=A0ABW7EMD0_9BURK
MPASARPLTLPSLIASASSPTGVTMLNLPPLQETPGLNDYAVLYWNHVGLQMNRITHSLGGPQGGPTMSSRALGLLHLAMHDAYLGWLGSTTPSPYLPVGERPAPPAGADAADADAALTGAALHVLDALYANAAGAGISLVARDTLTSSLNGMVSAYLPRVDVLSPAHCYGSAVAVAVMKRLAVQPGEPGADQGRYEPRHERSYFSDEPINPLRQVLLDPNDPSRGTRSRRVYHGPYYGETARTFAVHDAAGHQLQPPPYDKERKAGGVTAPAAAAEYVAAVEEVKALGGARGQPGTTRTPDQTVAGVYWAYDGANLIGTPPRLYNQIVREIAWARRDPAATPAARAANTAAFVRLFALCNVAMADAGKFSWKEKYRWDFWRPLTGVREHDTAGNPIRVGDPFWVSLGAPDTNTNRISFKPPFPAYPSGHATFGAACFQMVRLFYKQGVAGFDPTQAGFDPNKVDDIEFTFVSEELNGVSRDLYAPHDPALPLDEQPGTVRTRIERSFPSLWSAIFENAFSRIYLGVHWRFDAAAAADIKQPGTEQNKPAHEIVYSEVWTAPRGAAGPFPTGGVPLGLGIANDIWRHGLTPPVDDKPAGGASSEVKHSNTTRG